MKTVESFWISGKRRFHYFKRLPWKIKLLMGIAYLLTGIVRGAILIVPFRYLSRLLGEKNGSTSSLVEEPQRLQAAKVGWVVETISFFTPWESKCLVKAITAQLLLRVLRIPSTLYLGVGKDESQNLIAHAWLRCGELILTGANEKDQFRSVAQFASLLRLDA